MTFTPSQAQAQTSVLAAANDIIDNNELYFITRLNVYYLKAANGWTHFVKDALADQFPVCCDRNVRDALRYQMKDRGRVYSDVTYSVKPVANMLNLLDMSRWVQPTPGEYHWLFDTIIQTLSAGDAEKIEHLERCVAYKFTTPDCPRLPAILIHGEGSCGKNLLVEQVLNTLFGGAAASGTVDTLMGQFNTPLIGKVVALIDEATAKKVNHDKLKNMLGSTVFWANEKGIKQYECPALAWVFISSNKHEGGIFLDRSRADRRYSIFHVEQTRDLYYWIMPRLMADVGKEITVEQAAEWMEANAQAILTDKQNVSHWIHTLIEKHKGKPMPLAYHGEDFNRMLDIQKPVEECIIPDVFNDPEFTHINRQTLYNGYKLLCEHNGRDSVSSRYFYARVRAWLKLHKQGVIEDTEKQHRQRKYDHNNRCWDDGPSAWCWATNDALRQDKQHTSNDHKYIDTSDRYHPFWIGPEGL